MPIPAAYGQEQDSNQLTGPLWVWRFGKLLKRMWAMLWRCFGISPYYQPSILPWTDLNFGKKNHNSHLNIYLYHGNGFPFLRKRLFCMWMCVCVYLRSRKAQPPLPAPPVRPFVVMMYETASPLDYHRNMTVLLHCSPIMETDGTAPALFTLSTTGIRLVTLQALNGPKDRFGRGAHWERFSVMVAHVCLPCPGG